MKYISVYLLVAACFLSCKISYQFNGASIDYNVIKTINIKDFQNQATMVYPPLTQVFNETLKDHYTKNTRLSFTSDNADLELEGEITRYELTPQAVKEDAYASQTRLTIAVRIRYYNNRKPQENKEETVSAYRDFSSNVLLNDVQDQLIDEISKDIVDQIFNMTLSNW
ncbi:MAG: LPS assembly lipoprotein LptE [Prevotella sp.]|jgi:hypothetical protein|nr:LPS assembly lipoprotein LptE [Prevotella sp.]